MFLKYNQHFVKVWLARSIFLFLALDSVSFADLYYHPWESTSASKKQLIVAPEFSYYTANSNYDNAGNTVLPSLLTKFTIMELGGKVAYGFTDKVSAFGRLSWLRTDLEIVGSQTNSYGPGDQTLGLNFRLFESPSGIRFHLQGQADLATYDNVKSSIDGTPPLGNGTSDFTAGGFLVIPVVQESAKSLNLSGGAGFTVRSQDSYSSLIPWSVFLEFKQLPKGLQFKAGSFGIAPTKSNTGPVGVNPCTGNALGGSCYMGSLNPSLVNLRGEIGYQSQSGSLIGIKLTQSIWGKAAPKGFAVAGFIEFLMGEDKSGDAEDSRNPKDYGKSNQGFIDYKFEAKVTRVNDKFNLIKVNKGKEEGVKVGQVFDVFAVRPDGSLAEAVARARVTSVNLHESALNVVEYYKEVWIEEGFIAKQPLQ